MYTKWFLSVVVITCPSHGQGRRFDPGRNQKSFGFRMQITLRNAFVSIEKETALKPVCKIRYSFLIL